MDFESYMITFTKDKRRLSNFNDAKSKLTDLELFEAVNAIDDYDRLKAVDERLGLHTKEYLKKWSSLPGKLGCNLSYIKLFKEISLNEKFYKNFPSWFLILEDDTSILPNFCKKEINNLLTTANDLQIKFIKLFVSSGRDKINGKKIEFSPKIQTSQKYHIQGNLYRSIPSWGTWGQIFHISLINDLLEKMPWNDHVDKILMQFNLEKKYNFCYYDQNFLRYLGAKKHTDKSSSFGSLIFENNKDESIFKKL